MKLVYLALALLVLVQLSHAQKGGAKGAMRNRGRGGGGAGRRGGARNGEDDDDDDIASILERYDYSKPRPCVGLCYIKKLAGEGPVKYPPRVKERTSCVGMCHRDRVKGLKTKTLSALRKKRQEGRPCVGLCYISKVEKMNRRNQRRMLIRKKVIDKMSKQ